MARLAPLGYRCLAPDQRGYSDGARPDGFENYSFKKLAADVIGFADLAGCSGKFHLVGHDIGTAPGWNVVTLYPFIIDICIDNMQPIAYNANMQQVA